ncbi:protein mono-ADP-ribosyltransferase PARP14-like [Suncus etruscus]|uniref:protein mono-ADP-ribosyltransferase PARP14-like n=1 Tax=Suncus etruscus TaxID=109475 RepID=UPI002110288E|nr:protein mono-ADP-ribosyltransferase PARP14-like [Suncus etruscus]
MAAPPSFPLLVEGSWGPDPPRNLSTKLQMYFQSSKRSGGGECEVRPVPGTPPRFLVLFSPEDVRNRVLEKENHELAWPGNGPFKLILKLPTTIPEAPDVNVVQLPTKFQKFKSKDNVKQPDASEEMDETHSVNKRSENSEDTTKEPISSLVAFENLGNTVTDLMLILLVENTSELTSDDFQVEVIRDFEVAVVTFHKNIDIMKFIDDCANHSIVKSLQLSPRLLEVTKTIRVENLPPGVDVQNLKGLFEDPLNGGGRVLRVDCFPEESSALIEFYDREVLDTILTKKIDLDNVPLSMFPYYTSLGTALYGKEKPLIKLPAPFIESLDHLLWKFLKKNNHLMEEILSEMAQSHCEITWSELSGEITIRPAATLVNQGRKKIKTWQKDISTALSNLRSKYKITSFEVDPIVWDTIKINLNDDYLLIEFDTVLETVTLVGRSEDVEYFEPQMKELIEGATEIIKREQQILREKLAITPGKYCLLCQSGTLEHYHTEFPEMEMVYDEASQNMCFKGLPVEVYKVKCEIQEKVYSMSQKIVQVPSEVFQFLQRVNCAEFSRSLFIEQNILAIFELQSTTLLLISCSSQVLEEAEMQLMSALSFKRLEVEDRKVLDGKNWKGLTSHLQKDHSSSLESVIIQEITSETTAEVIIAGCAKKVVQVHASLFDFLEKHTIIERSIEVKPSLVLYYLKSERKALWQKLKSKNVQVQYNLESSPRSILLTGPKSQVGNTINLVKEARDSVCVRSIQIDKPGVREFFQEKAWVYRSEVKKRFGCFIELEEKEENAVSSNRQDCYLKTELAPGVTLIVQQGDLTLFPVEVVVNAVNEDLKHIGGLAAALSKVAGPELQLDCDRIVKSQGKVLPGSAIISKAGKLPFSHVIHAVGPRWEKDKAKKCTDTLKRAVQESLRLAENHKYQSIAIPAISSGVFGFPIHQCTETIVSAIKENYQLEWEGHTLKKIYLIDITENAVKAFAEAVKTQFKYSLPGTASKSSNPDTIQPDLKKNHEDRKVLWTPTGLMVVMVKGDVQNATTDVIVNSISSDLELKSGTLSQALLKEAGPELQNEVYRTVKLVTVNVGTVLQTSGCNLPCKHVLHVVLPDWMDDSTSSHKIMEDIIRKCLEITERLSLKSIAFPAIGTGNLGFPKKHFAKLILSEVLKFSGMNPATTLKEVHFLLHPSDHENIQAFSDVFSQTNSGNFLSEKSENQTADTDAQGFYGNISSPNIGVHQMKIGPITFQVATGDITKEKADVIVNSTSNSFTLKAGVSKAILEGAGKDVEMQCSLQAQQSNNGNSNYIVTDGGLLRCKNIVHVIGGNDIKYSVSCVLQECEKRNYSSICLPAIGTGQARQDPVQVADAIIEAIENFIRKGHVHSMKNVKVVLFQPQLLDKFYTSMKKREGSSVSPQKSLISKVTSYISNLMQKEPKKDPLVLKKKTEPVFFQVCGDDIKQVECALSWIKDLIIKEQYSFSFKDECIKDFDEKEFQELNELQKGLNITLSLDINKLSIDIEGISRDVMEARNKIELIIKRFILEKEEKSRADSISEFVEWQYNYKNNFHRFNNLTNLQLEDARRTRKKTVNVMIKDQKYTVDLTTNMATNAKGDILAIQRLNKAEVEIPSHWSDMQQQNICVVDLPSNHQEYIAVANKFNQTCSAFVIEKIERIQNIDLWNSYQMKKKTMDAKNSNIINEKQLFHGTDVDSVPYVNRNGFNRSYAGKNGKEATHLVL